MNKDNISPEERLLKLIRKEKKPPAPSPAQKQESHFSLPALIQKCLTFAYIRKVTFVALALSCLYLISSLIYPIVGLRKVKLPKITSERMAQVYQEPKIEIRPYETYLEGIKNRKIFASSSTTPTEQPLRGVNLEVMKNINLVGIISGENPQAIIEDKLTQKTHYLNKGQFIGEFQIEEIQEGKIIVNYRGEKFELYL